MRNGPYALEADGPVAATSAGKQSEGTGAEHRRRNEPCVSAKRPALAAVPACSCGENQLWPAQRHSLRTKAHVSGSFHVPLLQLRSGAPNHHSKQRPEQTDFSFCGPLLRSALEHVPW